MRTNFGGNVALNPQSTHLPRSEQEVLDLLNQFRGRRIRVIGRLHSWSRVLETDDVLLDLRHLNDVRVEANGETPAAVAGAGCQIKRLLAELAKFGPWTTPSLGFVTEQTIAGAVSTGTHGSGRSSLSHFVLGVRVARYDSESGEAIIEEIDDGDALRAARCSLGCLGVILSVRMQLRPRYLVEEHFRRYDRIEDVLAAEDEFPLQQFYLGPWMWAYFAQHRREVDGPSSMLAPLYRWYRFLVFDLALHFVILTFVRWLNLSAAVRWLFRWLVPISIIRNWRATGPSHLQLVMEHELFRHVEIELFVQRSQLAPAIVFVQQTLCVAAGVECEDMGELPDCLAKLRRGEAYPGLAGGYSHHFPICIRKIDLDDTLISMACASGDAESQGVGEDWYSISMINFQRQSKRQPFDQLASFLAESMSQLFGARPHWGKICPLDAADLRRLYPQFEIFREICDSRDPDGRFRNDWTAELLD